MRKQDWNRQGFRVSVIIPTRNSETTLRNCLESTRNQSQHVYEVIVVDNSNTNSTINIAKQFDAKVLTSGSKPRNASSSRNAGLLDASGDYVLFLDSDEILERRVVEECVTICKRKDIEMVKIPLRFVGKSFWGSSSAFWRNCHYSVGKRNNDNFPRFFGKKLISAVAFDENLDWGEDLDLYSRVKALTVRAAYSRSCMIHFEPSSLREIIFKQVQYSKVIPAFMRHTNSRITLNLIKNWCLSLKEATSRPPTNPSSVAGCFMFVFIKTLAVIIGFSQGRIS